MAGESDDLARAMAFSWAALSFSTTMPTWLADALGSIVWVALFFGPTFAALVYVLRCKRVYLAAAEEPFSDLLLRPPGESTRVAAEALFEKFTDRAMWLLGASACFGLTVSLARANHRHAIGVSLLILLLVIAAFMTPKMVKLIRDYWDYQLGFKGERFVGQHLNSLFADGFHVFHDVPFEKFNIDHVVVGSTGVFAIETKMRRKNRTKARVLPFYRVRYDGSSLLWPCGFRDQRDLKQASRNARSLAEWLSQATGEQVRCRGVLTYPGWFIEQTVPTVDVAVVSGKQLSGHLGSVEGARLTGAQIRRIAHQLSTRCRLEPEAKDSR